MSSKGVDFRYIAGFFDGEGSVSSFAYNKSRRPQAAQCPHLSIAQTDPRILQEIQAYLGYGVIWHNRLTIRGKKNIIHFADNVGPHLRVKKRRVMLAKEMALLVRDDNQPVPKTVQEQREEIALEIRRITKEVRSRARTYY